jgi:MFS transporter, DHA1 family, multidrug resistance protein
VIYLKEVYMLKAQISNTRKSLFMLIVYLAVPFSGLCMDLYSPSLPAITHAFATSKHLVQVTMTIYMMAFAFGQLLAGALSDRYGRRLILLIGCVSQMIVVLAIIFNTSINILLLLRLLQGISVAFIVAPSRAIVADLYTGADFNKYVKRYMMMWALGPIVAPWIGGHLQHAFGWQASFAFMLIYVALIFLLVIFILRETNLQRNSCLSLGSMLQKYKMMSCDKFFVASLVVLGMSFGLILLFMLKAPFIIEHVLGRTPVVYGRMALCLGVSLFLGNIACGRAKDLSYNTHMKIGISLLLLGVALFWGLVLSLGISIVALMVPNLFFAFAVGFMVPGIAPHVLKHFPTLAGMANALFFAGGWLVNSLVGYIGSFFNPMHYYNYLGMVTSVVFLVILIFYKFLLTSKTVPQQN